ncbi:hypothetical protein PENSPDRAFT_752047 [Peniophora sp. CONT]|nr:hypothetical protein PENSPDRAFT_752047 [Peniophora sp. CONT]
MAAADPTYPLLPIATLLSAVMLVLVLLTSFIRQRWNLGVTFLCFWLIVESVTGGANYIIWSDNADVKLWVYCDIGMPILTPCIGVTDQFLVSRAQIIGFVVKPMATLIITRRLYLVASLKSVELPNETTRRRNLLIEWTLGLVIPILVAGPIYYTIQVSRFQVVEVFGCGNASAVSVFVLVAIESWGIIPPVISLAVYYPRVARIFYLHSRDINHFLRSNGSVSRTNYLRILALASLDILLTLPIGIVNVVLNVTSDESQTSLRFYPGWARVHSNWEPLSYSYAELQATGVSALPLGYFTYWTSPVLAFTIFGLFGMTAEARATYWGVICTVGGWFGWKPSPRAGNLNAGVSLGTIEFGAQPQETMTLDAEMGSHPSFIDTNIAQSNRLPAERDVEDATGSASSEPNLNEREMNLEQPNELRTVPSEEDHRPKSVTADTTAAPVEA